jgi:hypothetical protein
MLAKPGTLPLEQQLQLLQQKKLYFFALVSFLTGVMGV